LKESIEWIKGDQAGKRVIKEERVGRDNSVPNGGLSYFIFKKQSFDT
jgi:hypothetical protein